MFVLCTSEISDIESGEAKLLNSVRIEAYGRTLNTLAEVMLKTCC